LSEIVQFFFEGAAMEWKFGDAKTRFSEVINFALTQGPQRVRRGKDIVVIVAAEEFERLTGQRLSIKQRPSIKEFLMQGESFEGLAISRDSGPDREFTL
jgi:prevent-host-death family protein